MDTLVALWIALITAAAWLLMVGAIRLLAYRTGTDRTPGMASVAGVALGLGAVAAVAAAVVGFIVVPELW